MKLFIATFRCPIKETTYHRGEQDQYAKRNRNKQKGRRSGNTTPSEPLDSAVPETIINSRCLRLLLVSVTWTNYLLCLNYSEMGSVFNSRVLNTYLHKEEKSLSPAHIPISFQQTLMQLISMKWDQVLLGSNHCVQHFR